MAWVAQRHGMVAYTHVLPRVPGVLHRVLGVGWHGLHGGIHACRRTLRHNCTPSLQDTPSAVHLSTNSYLHLPYPSPAALAMTYIRWFRYPLCTAARREKCCVQPPLLPCCQRPVFVADRLADRGTALGRLLLSRTPLPHRTLLLYRVMVFLLTLFTQGLEVGLDGPSP